MSPTLKTSFIAAWLAPPPIQLPATVVNPRQTCSTPALLIIEGEINETTIMEIGPPKIIPKVPVKNITIALDPNFLISGISMLIVSRAKLVGNKYLEATK